jgi:Gpi18-like mannosyltransferase
MGVGKKDLAALGALCLSFLLMAVLIQSLLGYPALEPSPYNSYTLQAMAWRKGQTYLDTDVPHLELAIYKGRFFVSFPPVPSLPIYLLSFLFGSEVPDGLLIKLYALLSLLILFRLLRRHVFSPCRAAFWAFTLCFSSSLLPLIWTGAVWYQAQVLAFLLIIGAVDQMDRDRPLPGLILYALAVGCRPFHALYGPLLILLYAYKKQKAGAGLKAITLKLLPGLASGILIALLYAAYNFIRFDNPFEFGHNHLPEFSFQGGTQFSLRHVADNLRQYVFSLPFDTSAEGLKFRQFGFSLFLANPVLLLLVFWGALDAVRRQFRVQQGMILLFFSLHLFFLLMHRTFGGFQYGARYAVDLIPYAVLYLVLRQEKKPGITEAAVMFLGLGMSIFGSLVIRIL